MSWACRVCRNPLAGADGCAICNPIKANLVSTDEEAPALSDVGTETVTAMRAILQRHRSRFKSKDSTEEQLLGAEEGIIRVGNTLAKVLEAARKLQADGLAVVRNMSFEQRADLFISWYTSLPPPYQVKVQKGMAEFHEKMNQPLPLPAGGAAEE